MKLHHLTLISVLSIALIASACDKEVFLSPRDNQEVHFQELPEEAIPPCLYTAGIGFDMVIKNTEDYEELRRNHAPQGDYEYFEVTPSDERSFRLSYQPLDTNYDGEIGPEDIVIYVRGTSFYTTIDGQEYEVNSYPFYVWGDSIGIYKTEPPYTLERKIHYEKIFHVNPQTGEVTFHEPLQNGTRISMSANRLFSSYEGRTCSMDNFNFKRNTIIGKKIVGNGCLYGFDKEISVDYQNKQVVYKWWKKEYDTSNGCPSIALSFTSWVSIIPPPPGYEVVFEERVLP